MKIAVQGCAHGELENIYSTIEYIEKQNNINVDLLLCCGDFQATRNLEDLKCMAAPPKFRSLCTFYKYYSGEKIAPKLTIFIGGNHEASNYLQELPYGGWVAPNIYYLGYAGVVNFAGIRIAGLSGIFKGWDFARGRYEKPPYNDETLRSCYHIRNLDVFRLKQLTQPTHIMLSHDWPAGIFNYGNIEKLLKDKPYFREDIEKNSLGNKPAAELLECMKPDYWFAAHLHVKFPALVKHNDTESKLTKFLALDKCLPRRKFLQILDIPHDSEIEMELKYDLEWLTILHLTNHLLSVKKLNLYMPSPESKERWDYTPTKEDMNLILTKLENNLVIPKNFVRTAPAHNSNTKVEFYENIKVNLQTVEFCKKISIDDPMALLRKEDGFNDTCSSVNSSMNFESSSFIGSSESELETSSNNSNLQRRKVTRTPLKLPNPNNFQQIENSEIDIFTSTPLKKNVESKNSEPSSIDGNNDCEKTPTAPPADDSSASASKKFRRRNEALYSSANEE